MSHDEAFTSKIVSSRNLAKVPIPGQLLRNSDRTGVAQPLLLRQAMSVPLLPVLVWIDRSHARLFCFDQVSSDQAPLRERSFHSQSPNGHQFMEILTSKLESATRILIVGPGVAKYRFFAFVRETAPQIARKVVGCENLEHPHDFQLQALAEKHFGMIPNPTEV